MSLGQVVKVTGPNNTNQMTLSAGLCRAKVQTLTDSNLGSNWAGELKLGFAESLTSYLQDALQLESIVPIV
jgi:hypothetical protein